MHKSALGSIRLLCCSTDDDSTPGRLHDINGVVSEWKWLSNGVIMDQYGVIYNQWMLEAMLWHSHSET